MCKYTKFFFLCGASKLKIAIPCMEVYKDFQGILHCPKDPHAHIDDGNTHRVLLDDTYGPGICSNQNCRDAHGMTPFKFVAKGRFSERDLVEDDREFDMSPEACVEREDRYFRLMLNADQQLDCISMRGPTPLDQMCTYALLLLNLEQLPQEMVTALAKAKSFDNPDDMTHLELNPRYLNQRALQHVTARFLPANITDTRNSSNKVNVATTTNRKPIFGPFKMKSHTCKPNVGFCKTCHLYHGKKYKHKPNKFVEHDYVAMINANPPIAGRPPIIPVHGNNASREEVLGGPSWVREKNERLAREEYITKQCTQRFYYECDVSKEDDAELNQMARELTEALDEDAAKENAAVFHDRDVMPTPEAKIVAAPVVTPDSTLDSDSASEMDTSAPVPEVQYDPDIEALFEEQQPYIDEHGLEYDPNFGDGDEMMLD